MSPPELVHRLFGPDAALLSPLVATRIGAVIESFDAAEALETMSRVDVLITGWGAPPLTDDVVDAAPRLRLLLHAGGAPAHLLTPRVAERGIEVVDAGLANAVPVAEYTLAMILLSNKRAFESTRLYRERRRRIDRETEFADSGNFGRTVGIVSASRIGRLVMEHLRRFDLDVLVYDPYLSPVDAADLGARSVDLDELLRVSDVVSVHTPVLPETIGLIGRRELALLPDGATLINSARGAIIDQGALIDELRTGRIHAVLDVTTPDVLEPTNPLYDLPNVVLTPHIAGSMGTELLRMGEFVVGEFERALVDGRLVSGAVRA
jgi:phosphoglycerate dehydrogenase-like enzyme